ncbi:MAG: VWA domain-containing protein [Gemmatimonadaceae bacterium]|nr:VWA domain-containing protein [Gemmatimonadaceae bacterium]
MRSFLIAFALTLPALAGSQIIEQPRPWPCPVPPCRRGEPCIQPACGLPFATVVRKNSDVRVELIDRVLRYEVTETFINRGDRVGEADYMFPLPKGAALQDLKLSVNGEMVSGETMSAERARSIYEEIVRQRRDPALLEWMGYGLLRARIFPIAPGEEKKVVVRFQVVSPREGDALRIDFFRGANNRGRTGDDPEGTTSFALSYPASANFGTAYSPTHSVSTYNRGSRRSVEVRDARGEITLLVPVRRTSQPAISLLANAPGNGDGFALITLSPPAIARRAVPRDITFVIDVSGSMSGKKIAQARAAGKQLLNSLSAVDRFRLIDFATDVRSFRDGWSTANSGNIRAAERYLDALDASGSTNISGALDEALAQSVERDRLPIILFLTDGQPTVGEHNGDLIAARVARNRGARRLFTFGVGADLNISLIEQLALEGRGTASFVRPDESVERAVGIVAERLTNPVVTDLRVNVDGVRLRKMHPAGAVDVFAGEDMVLLARYEGSGNATLRFEGTTANGPVTWSSAVNFPDRSRDNPFVARLWATQRVGYLSAEKRKQGSSSEIDAEIRELGERFGIPTEFSSYLVVEPGMRVSAQMNRRAGVVAGGVATGVATATSAPAASTAFDAAKSASGLRAARSTAAADSANEAYGNTLVKRAGNRTFILRDSIWTDNRKSAGPVLRVKPYSAAYFRLLDLIPELREPLSLAERVRVSGRAMSIEIAPGGLETLSGNDITMLKQDW